MSKALRYANVDALPKGLQDAARKALNALPKPQAPLPIVHGIDQGHPDGDSAVLGVQRPDGVVTIASCRTQRKNKYGAVVTHVNGIRFDSKREAAYYERLCLRVQLGEVRYFLRQVPLHLPGGTRLVVDFLEVHADGSLHYVDVKGRETDAFKIKRREIQAVYPITIELA